MKQGIQHIINYFFWALPSSCKAFRKVFTPARFRKPRRSFFNYCYKASGRAFATRFCPKSLIEVPKNLPFGEMSATKEQTEGPKSSNMRSIPNASPLWGDVFLQEKDRGAFKIPNSEFRILNWAAAFLFCVIALQSFAQEYVLDRDTIQEKYGHLINMEANTLKFADDSPYFKTFFSKMDSMYEGKKEKLHIFHIGGSHIQADIYSNKIRTYLQNMNEISTSQRGFVFPYHLAQTNNPSNYRVEADRERWEGFRCSDNRDTIAWGLSGVTAVFRDTLDTIRIKSNHRNYTKKPYCFNKLRVFYNTWKDDYTFKIIDSTLVVSDTINTEAHYREFEFVTDAGEVEIELKLRDSTITDPEFLLMGLELMNDDPGIEYTSIGANGAKFKSFARCTFFEQQLALYKPDLFIISIGTNDAYTPRFKSETFRKRYEDFIQMIQRINPNCAILLTVPNDSYYRRRRPNKNTATQEKIILELAQKYKMAVWDFYEVMGGLGSSQNWYESELMPKDRIHFTFLGYSIKADLFLNAFLRQWETVANKPEECLLTHFKTLNE